MRKAMGLCAISALCVSLCLCAQSEAANPAVATATKHYLKGSQHLKKKRFGQAIRAFRRAYRSLPRHPHFHCHRAQFLNYIGAAHERQKRPYKAMRTYYSAYRQGCGSDATRGHALRAYRRLDKRWMCAVHFHSAPHKVRVYQVTSKGETKLGLTPLKTRWLPGKYRFKLRLFDHRTVYWKIQLRPGQRLKRSFKMLRGDDPVTAPENPNIAPPIALSKAKAPKQPRTRPNPSRIVLKAPPKEREKDPKGAQLPGMKLKGHVKTGPPVYKQAWFWAVIGGVAVAAVVIPIVVPKEQNVRLGQSPIFQP